jgi:hypothetical protein
MLLYNIGDGEMNKLVIHFDSGTPLAWKQELYCRQLKQIARNGMEHNGVINVYIGKRVVVVLPTEDLDLGICEPTDQFSYEKHWTGFEWKIKVCKLPASALSS